MLIQGIVVTDKISLKVYTVIRSHSENYLNKTTGIVCMVNLLYWVKLRN